MIKDFNYICGKILGISDSLEMQGDDISKRAAEKLRECVSDLDLCAFSEWKDIKTAPRRTWVNIYYPMFDTAGLNYSAAVRSVFITDLGNIKYGCEVRDSSNIRPTHWRPLPNPPYKLSVHK